MRRLPILIALSTLAPMTAGAACGPDTLDSHVTAEQLADLDARAATWINGQGLAWTAVRGDDQLTLIGTIHIYDPRIDTLLERFSPAISQADVVLVEMTLDDQADMQAELVAQPDLLLLPNNETLLEMMPEQQWSLLATALEARGLPPFMAARFQPWYLSTLLSIPACYGLAGATTGGLDMMIMTQAADAGTPIQALEDWRDTIAQLANDPIDEQLDALTLSQLPPDFEAAAFNSFLNDFFAGNVARSWEWTTLAASLVPGADPDKIAIMTADMKDDLLAARNGAWMSEIEAVTKTADEIVIAVGAMHLPGDFGLVHLLEQDGWTVTRLDTSNN